jgi:hypothetical protein
LPPEQAVSLARNVQVAGGSVQTLLYADENNPEHGETTLSSLKYSKPERISLKGHSELNERWVQERIAEDPALLGLGDLIVKDKERIHPQGGRLDLLCQDAESDRRYEIEIQLGKSDESHIIRTIEYWDIERKRYPQYEHTAVLVAEEITSRFLNVISLFNGFIPLVAIQMQALRFDDQVCLVFTTVLNEMRLGLVDEDEERQEVTDRAYWEKRGTKGTLEITDSLLGIVNEFAPDLTLKYNKFYIGLASKSGQPNNFVIFRPKKDWVRFEPRLDRSEEVQAKLETAGIDVMEYDSRWGRYRIRLGKSDVQKHGPLLRELMKSAYGADSE